MQRLTPDLRHPAIRKVVGVPCRKNRIDGLTADFCDILRTNLQKLIKKTMEKTASSNAHVYKPFSQAAKDLAGRIVDAVVLDEQDEGCDIGAGLFGRNLSALIAELAEQLEPPKADSPLPQESLEILAGQIKESDPDFYVCEQHGELLISREEPSDPAYVWRPVWYIHSVAHNQLLAFIRYPDTEQPSDYLKLPPIELEAFQRLRNTLGGAEFGLYEALCLSDTRIRRLQHENTILRAPDADKRQASPPIEA